MQAWPSDISRERALAAYIASRPDVPLEGACVALAASYDATGALRVVGVAAPDLSTLAARLLDHLASTHHAILQYRLWDTKTGARIHYTFTAMPARVLADGQAELTTSITLQSLTRAS